MPKSSFFLRKALWTGRASTFTLDLHLIHPLLGYNLSPMTQPAWLHGALTKDQREGESASLSFSLALAVSMSILVHIVLNMDS